MIHGDNQYNPKYVANILESLSKDTTISAIAGSRMAKKTDALKGKMPIYKFIGNIFLTGLFNFFFNTKFTDCHTGYWGYNLGLIKKNVFKNLDDNFCFDIDFRLKLVSEKKKIKEIPIKTFYGTERSSIHLIYALRFFLKIIKFRLFD